MTWWRYDTRTEDCNFHRKQTFGRRIDHLFVYFLDLTNCPIILDCIKVSWYQHAWKGINVQWSTPKFSQLLGVTIAFESVWYYSVYVKFKFKFNLFGFISSHFTIRIDKMIMLNQRCGCHQKRRAWGWWHPVMLHKYRKKNMIVMILIIIIHVIVIILIIILIK